MLSVFICLRGISTFTLLSVTDTMIDKKPFEVLFMITYSLFYLSV